MAKQKSKSEPAAGKKSKPKKSPKSQVRVRREGDTVIVSVPVKFYRRNGRQMVLVDGDVFSNNRVPTPKIYTALLTNLAKAWKWQEQLESGKFQNTEDIARTNKVDRTHVSRILQLTAFSPIVVEQILAGKEPESLSLRQLRKGIPIIWRKQY